MDRFAECLQAFHDASVRFVIELCALTSAIGEDGLHIDLSLVMAGFEFGDIWSRRRTFVVNGVEIPLARLTDIVTSKANADREKDRLFLAAHKEAISRMHANDEAGDDDC